jgi:hypothetical protein
VPEASPHSRRVWASLAIASAALRSRLLGPSHVAALLAPVHFGAATLSSPSPCPYLVEKGEAEH